MAVKWLQIGRQAAETATRLTASKSLACRCFQIQLVEPAALPAARCVRAQIWLHGCPVRRPPAVAHVHGGTASGRQLESAV